MNQEKKETLIDSCNWEYPESDGMGLGVLSPDSLKQFMDLQQDPLYRERLEYYSGNFDFTYLIEPKAVVELSKREIADLYEMRLRKAKTIGFLKKLERLLLQFITLIFGLCSSQSSLIFRSFFGPSLFRTPAL